MPSKSSDGVLLGHHVHDGTPLRIPWSDFVGSSCHLLGAPGSGKSGLLANATQTCITHRQPFGIGDPHNALLDETLVRLRKGGIREKQIVVLDTCDPDYSVGLNPLVGSNLDTVERGSSALDSFLSAWHVRSMDSTPRLERMARSLLITLATNQLSLAEAPAFLAVDNVPLRRLLVSRVSDPYVQADWGEFEKAPRGEKQALVESVVNRVRRFLIVKSVQRMVAQTERTVDFDRILAEGMYLLLRTGDASVETQRLLSSMTIHGIYQAAKRRRAPAKPWIFFQDEASLALDQTIVSSLDELRKRNVRFWLAHQRLHQLEREDPDICSSVLTGCRLKIVMGGLPRDEAERMARELYTGDVRSDVVKHRTVQTKFRPISELREVESESVSESEGWSQSAGSSWGESSGGSESITDSHGEFPDDWSYRWEDHPFQRSESSSSQIGRSSGRSESSGTGRTRTSGRTRSVVNVVTHEEFSEESGRQFFSLSEEWEKRIALVHGLGHREALVKIGNGPVWHIRTADVSPVQVDGRAHRYRRRVMERCPYAQPVADANRAIEDRRRLLDEAVAEAEEQRRPHDVRSFRE